MAWGTKAGLTVDRRIDLLGWWAGLMLREPVDDDHRWLVRGGR